MQKGHSAAIINPEKGNSILAYADKIRPKSKTRKKSLIPCVSDLLEQTLLNQTLEDEIIHDQVGHNEFENWDEDQIMHEDDLD